MGACDVHMAYRLMNQSCMRQVEEHQARSSSTLKSVEVNHFTAIVTYHLKKSLLVKGISLALKRKSYFSYRLTAHVLRKFQKLYTF